MDEQTAGIHLRAGEAYGRDATCGQKIDYQSEESADRAASAMNNKGKSRHELEPYPCFWCRGWHVGRKMTEEERVQFS